MIHGTWRQTGGGSGGLPKELIMLGVLVAVMAGIAGAVQAAVTALMVWLIAAVAVAFVLAVAGGAAFLLLRARRGGAPLLRGIVPEPVMHQLPGPERAALAPARAPDLHLHFHGTDPEQVAEILRRQSRQEP